MFSCFLAMVIKGNKFPFSTILTQIMHTQMYFAKCTEKNSKFPARSKLKVQFESKYQNSPIAEYIQPAKSHLELAMKYFQMNENKNR